MKLHQLLEDDSTRIELFNFIREWFDAAEDPDYDQMDDEEVNKIIQQQLKQKYVNDRLIKATSKYIRSRIVDGDEYLPANDEINAWLDKQKIR